MSLSSSKLQADVNKQLDAKLAEMQNMLKDLAAKVEEAEEGNVIDKSTQSASVADAYKDIVKAEDVISSFESRLDQLLGRLDNMIDEQENEGPEKDQEEEEEAENDDGESAEAADMDIQLSQLSAELDEIEKDIVLLSQFSGSRDEHRQFADSVRDQQRTAERLIERALINLDDIQEAKLKSKVQATISQQQNRTKNLQRAFRTALLQYRANAAGSAKRDRELLLSGAATPAELRKRKVRTGNAVLNVAADVTSALQETVSMMNAEIDKSVGNTMALQDSSDMLQKTKSEYLTMDGVLKTSKSLIKVLEQADAMDRWLMLGGLVLFAAVSFNILRKRIWIPGLSTLFSVIKYFLFSSSSNSNSSVGITEKIAAVTTTSVDISKIGHSLKDLPLAMLTATLTSAVVIAAAAVPSGAQTKSIVIENVPAETESSVSLLSVSAYLSLVEPANNSEQQQQQPSELTGSTVTLSLEMAQFLIDQLPVPEPTPEPTPTGSSIEPDEQNISASVQTTTQANGIPVDDVEQPANVDTTSEAAEHAESLQNQEAQVEEPNPHRIIYTLPVERPVREEL
ncbi:Vesicle transport protein S20 [Kickxella alabastrina]|uniref:Vesicle transport protein S20 n=1 Tax=Kickxella alabastrina TaxID=61397 RepID=A0ACC1ICJ5_9FUNG|nr:Vesicle transport protein S20 [Kickxella alabastrina]